MPARKVTRSIHEGARDLARDIATTDAYLISRRQRKKVEMLFAHLKRILKLDRLRLRGPNGARDEFLLAATAQNLRKLAKLIPMPAQTAARLSGSGAARPAQKNVTPPPNPDFFNTIAQLRTFDWTVSLLHMTWKRVAMALLLGAVAMPAAFAALRPVFILWYMHDAPNDGQSAISVYAGSLYSALLCGLVTFGVVLSRGRKRR